MTNHTCYYFNNIININSVDLDYILLNQKSYEVVLTYDVVFKTTDDLKHLRSILIQ